ncbi:MAG: DNA repair protein RadC [Parasphingorhabdus sp.]
MPPAPIEGARDRSVLAQLIAPVEPEIALDLASALLDEFGSIGRILSESYEALQRVVGERKAVIELLLAAKKLLMAELENEVPKQLVAATDENLIRYLQAGMGSLAVETLRVLFLNNANYLVGDQEFGAATPSKILVQPRSILKRALELNASAIILVHNHPSGEIRPSKSDIKFTLSIKVLCRELEISLHDHIIIAGRNWSSFQKMRIL